MCQGGVQTTFDCFKRGIELPSSTLLCARKYGRALGVLGVQEVLWVLGYRMLWGCQGCAGFWGYLGCAGLWGYLGCAGLWCAIISVSGLSSLQGAGHLLVDGLLSETSCPWPEECPPQDTDTHRVGRRSWADGRIPGGRTATPGPGLGQMTSSCHVQP